MKYTIYLILLVSTAETLRIPYLSPVLEHLPYVGKYFGDGRKINMASNAQALSEGLANVGKVLQDSIDEISTDIKTIVEKAQQIYTNNFEAVNVMVNGILNKMLTEEMLRTMITKIPFPACDLVEDFICPVLKIMTEIDAADSNVQGAAKSLLSIVTTQSFGRIPGEDQLAAVTKILAQLRPAELKNLQKITAKLVAAMKESSDRSTRISNSEPSTPLEEKFTFIEEPTSVPETTTSTPRDKKIEL